MTLREYPKTVSQAGGYNAYSAGLPDGSSYFLYSQSWTDFHSGVENPLWRQQIATGSNATTGASGQRRYFNYGGASGDLFFFSGPPLDRRANSTTFYGPLVLGGPMIVGDPGPGIPFSDADISARVKFLSNIRQSQRSFQGGVFLGELRDTLRTIRNPLKALRSGIDSYHRTVKSRGAKAIPRRGRQSQERNERSLNKVASETWLEFMYGWRPLLSDIDDAARALAMKDLREKIPISSSGKFEVATDSTQYMALGTLRFTLKWQDKYTIETRYKGAVSGGPNPIGHPVLSRWGVSLNDFVPTIWELIPYSFLVDYFTNAGDLIEASTTCLSGLLWHCRTQHLTIERRLMSAEIDSGYYALWNSNDNLAQARGSVYVGGFQNKLVKFTRDVPILQVGFSDFRLELPGLSSTKWLNIGALANLRRY
jgi:hypothetical protein